MTAFIKEHSRVYVLIMIWAATIWFAGPLFYLVLPASVFLMRSRDMWPDMLFGFLVILIWSDMNPGIVPFRTVKTAKNTYIVALAIIYFMETARMQPSAGIFKVFLPFFGFSFLPIVASGEPLTSIQKTVSYALLYLVIPNHVLYCYRRQGWVFFRHLVIFIVVFLALQRALPYFTPHWWSFVAGRFRGFFGNPNGLSIFCYLCFMLVTVLFSVKPDLFSFKGKVVVYAVIVYFLIEGGSRTSVTSTLMFMLFYRFFAASPFLGFVAFLAFGAVVEAVSSNLPAILNALGLHEYFRVETIADGSGRYFAWSFAWSKINEGGFFLFGGGFGNDEFIMRQHYPYLRTMGHHGGVHNSYLTMWFNVGIVGILIFFRSFLLIFAKAVKSAPYAFAIMFSVMFSVLYESWITGSLNPFTIILLCILTVLSEDEIVNWRAHVTTNDAGGVEEAPTVEPVPRLILPAR